jgi:hypothetical protein
MLTGLMASGFGLAVAAIIATVLLLRLCPVFPAALGLMAIMARTSRAVKRRRSSDHWKERAFAALSVRMFAASTRFAIWLALALVPLLLAWMVAPLWGIDLMSVLLAWMPRIALVLIAIVTNMAINGFKRQSL